MEELNLLRLRAKAKAKADRERESQGETPQDAAIVQDVEGKEQVDKIAQAPEASTIESMSAGFIEGVPFMKDAVAGYDALKTAISNDTEDSVESIYADYKTNLDEVNKDINQAEKDNPWAFVGGDIAGSIATLPAAGLKGAMGIGALSGLSRSEERTIASAFEGAAAGAVFHGLGVFGGKVIKKGIEGTKNLMSGSAKEALGATNKFSLKTMNGHLVKTNQSGDDLVKSLFKHEIKMPDGKVEGVFTVGQTYEETLQKVGRASDQVWNEMTGILNSVDDVSLSSQKAYTKLQHKVVAPLLNSKYSEKRKLGERIATLLDDNFKTSTKMTLKETTDKGLEKVEEKTFGEAWSLSDLHSLKKEIGEEVYALAKTTESGVLTANTQKRKIISVLNDVIDEGVLSSKNGDPAILASWKQANLDYGNLATGAGMLERHIEGQGHGVMGTIKDLFAVRGVVVGGISASLGIGGLPALAIGAGLNRLISSGSMPATMAVGMQRLSKVLVSNPTGEVAKNLIRASQMPMLNFRRTVASEIGKIQLQETPLERTTDSVMLNRESISAVLEEQDPALAEAFRKAVDSGDDDTIGQFMDSASKQADLSSYLKAGVGFNGKVYSDEDKTMLINQLMPQSDLSLKQRMDHKAAIIANGTIPQVQPDDRQPIQHIPRRKDKHEY